MPMADQASHSTTRSKTIARRIDRMQSEGLYVLALATQGDRSADGPKT